jgi:hypothetical protein
MNIKVKQINLALSKNTCIPNNYQNTLTFTCQGQDGIIEFTIGEITNVLENNEKYIQRYGTYTSQDDSEVVFRKVNMSRMITVAAIHYEESKEESSHWIISLKDFLPFVFDPDFRKIQNLNLTLYSCCVFG